MTQLLLCPDTEISPNITASDNNSCHETIWETGHIIEKNEYDLSRLEFFCEDLPAGHFPDFAISDLGCPIVSNRLKDYLDQQGIDNIEYFPATIIEKIGETPLGQVSPNCSYKMAKFLVDNGANPCIIGWMGLTSLDRAKQRKKEEGKMVYELLLKTAKSKFNYRA